MIPKKLTLKNFLSYRQAELDFTGLHTACICGANGAGKSSLLEAITWVVWGKTRTASDDDLIYLGEKSMRVDYEFIYNDQCYRVIRSRQKKRGGSLDFQILAQDSYKSLSGKGIKDTQAIILECLKIDYDTFINSAYLRQGRADEFMLRKPSERKKILADLLKLDQYENLAEEAKDIAKQHRIRSDEISHNLAEQKVKLEEKEAIAIDLKNTEKELKFNQNKFTKIQAQKQEIESINNNRKTWLDKLSWQQNKLQSLQNQIQQLTIEKNNLEQELHNLNRTLTKEEVIIANYQKLEKLRSEDQELSLKFNTYQKLLSHKQKLGQEVQQINNQLILAIEREKTNLTNLLKQEKELKKIIGKNDNLSEDLKKLNYYRERLAKLDELHRQITPLMSRKQFLASEIKAEKSRLEAKLEQLYKEEAQLQIKLNQVPTTRNRFFEIGEKLTKISDSRTYQKRIKEKGEQQNELIQKYTSNKNSLLKEIDKLQKKLATLHQEQAICPLCERNLDEAHLDYVVNKTTAERKQIESESWYYEEQIINAQRIREQLRDEYRQINQELAIENDLKQEQAKLEHQLDLVDDIYHHSETIQAEKEQIESLLNNHQYAQSLQAQLKQIEENINQLDYNEEDHALLRKQEAELRRVEYQQLKIEDSQKKLAKLAQDKPVLEAKITELQTKLNNLQENSELQLQIKNIDAQIDELNYDSNEHNHKRESLRDLQSYQLLYGDLQQAQKQHPQLAEKLNQVSVKLENYRQEEINHRSELETIKEQLSQLADFGEQLRKLEQESSLYQDNINALLTKKGRLEQSLNNLEDREGEVKKLADTLKESQKNYRIYQELSIAFGKNGIQSLMIENILPQLEVEANHILTRLTGNQLHVQFVTQKPKSSRSKKSSAQFKDTLEIIIADASGTRPYETYSGGEAFRINFSIRLALSRILAQNSGTPLQLLIVDEGFGTQDAHGCERLIAALNAIAPEFSCILTVTHITQFKEAFETRIEVYKTENGSQIRVC